MQRLFLVFLVALVAAAQINDIAGERIRAHVKFLSSDLLEGRGTGQRGGEIAAAYIATQFALYGLKPAGDDGSYLQKVPMMGIATLPESTYSLIPAKGDPISLSNKEAIVAMDETGDTSTMIDSPIVWIGYGIDAPEFNWNDYKDIDVKGKVLLMLVNEPPSDDPNYFGGKALTYYGRWTYKYEQAARMGAAGVLLIHKTDMASYGWDVVRNSWSGERSYLRNDPARKLKLASWIQLDLARKLIEDCGKDLDKEMAAAAKPGFQAEQLPATFKAHIVSMSPGTGSDFAVLPPENATGNWVKVVQRLPVRLELDEVDPKRPLFSGISVTVRVDTGYRRTWLHLLQPARATEVK